MGWGVITKQNMHHGGQLQDVPMGTKADPVGEWLDTVNAPDSPANSQQLSNLIEYVVDALCFGDGNTSFDTSFKSLSGSQRSAQHIHEKEQAVRVDRLFGPVFKARPATPKEQAQHPPMSAIGGALQPGMGLGKPIKQESRQMYQQAPQAGVPNGVVNTLQQAIDKLNSRKSAVDKAPEAIKAMPDATLLEEKRNLKQGLRSFDVLFEKVTGRTPEKNDKEPLRTVYAYYKELKKEIGIRGTNHPTSAMAVAMHEKDDVPMRPTAPTTTNNHRYQKTGALPYGGAASARSSFDSARTAVSGESTATHQPQQQPQYASSYSLQQPQQPQQQPQQQQPQGASGGVSYVDMRQQLPTSCHQLTPEELESLKIEKKAIKRRLFEFMSRFKEKHGREVKSREDRAPCAAEYERYRHLKALLQSTE